MERLGEPEVWVTEWATWREQQVKEADKWQWLVERRIEDEDGGEFWVEFGRWERWIDATNAIIAQEVEWEARQRIGEEGKAQRVERDRQWLAGQPTWMPPNE